MDTAQKTVTKNLKRSAIIDAVILDLIEYRKSCDQQLYYAIDENIRFFEAARSLPRYIFWLLTKSSKINGHRILELSDFHLRDGEWEKMLLGQLLALERKNIPDLIGPLRKQLSKEIRTLAQQKKGPLVIMNMGCGGMETERRVALELLKKPLTQPVTFIGIDSSPAAIKVAQQNLQSFGNEFSRLESLTPDVIHSIKNDQTDKPVQFKVFIGDALNIYNYAEPQTIDILFHSKFHHHLSDQDKKRFDDMINTIACCTIEFDDYRGAYLPILSILTGWNKPILLNGAVISSLRDPTKEDINNYKREGWITKIYPLKGFLKIHHSSQTC